MLQLGVLGCSKAHERDEIDGCAGEVTGEMDLTGRGRVSGLVGWRIGEINALSHVSYGSTTSSNNWIYTYGHFKSAIVASESTISYLSGQ